MENCPGWVLQLMKVLSLMYLVIYLSNGKCWKALWIVFCRTVDGLLLMQQRYIILSDIFSYWKSSSLMSLVNLLLNDKHRLWSEVVFLFFLYLSPQGDKVSTLTHMNPHTLQGKIKVAICIHCSFYLRLMFELVICKVTFRSFILVVYGWEEYDGHSWQQISLLRPGVIKQNKTQFSLLFWCVFENLVHHSDNCI